MPAANRRDLYINIGGSASELGTATKAGRTALLELNQAAGSIVDQISENMRKIGASANAPLAEMERNFKTSLGNIRNELRSLQASGDQGATLKFFDQNSVSQQIAQGERLTAQYRLIAEAAQEVYRAGGANAEGARVWAASYGTMAAETELATQKLREQSAVQAEVLGRMGELPAASRAATQATGQQRAGLQQLAYNINDVTTMYGLHASAQQIFVSQSGQIIQSLSLMAQGGSGWLATVGQFAPYILIATSALIPLIGYLLKNNDALQQGVDKLKKNAAETEANRLATEAYNKTIEGEIELQRKLNDELDRSIRTQRQLNQNKLRDTEQRVTDLQTKRPGQAADVAAQELVVARLQNFSTANDPYGAQAKALADAQERLAKLRADLAATDQAITAGLRGIREAQVPLIQNDVEAQLDKNAAAARRYEIALGNLNQQLAIGAGNKAKRQFYLPDGTFDTRDVTGISAAEYQRQLAIITAQRKKDEKDARDANKTASAGSPSSALLSSAESYRGASEAGAGRDTLLALFKSANINIDPKITAWCAAFVNAVLATNGLPGTGNLAAKSFLNYGTATNSPQKGDIVVLNREGGGHVGFFEGFDAKGNVKVLGGNTGNKVGVATFNRSDVLGYRRAPASEQSVEDAAAKAAQKEAERRAGFERELGDETEKALSLAKDLAVTDEDRLDVKLATIAAEKENRDKALDGLVATGKLTQAEADQLKAVNARIADEKTSIATNKSIIDTRRNVLLADQAEYQAKATLLNLSGELATTNKDRLRIAKEALALEFEHRRKLAEAKAASRDPTEAAEGTRDLAALPAEQAARDKALEHQFSGPLERWKEDAADTKTILESIEVKGLDAMNDGLADAITNALHLHGIFGDILGDLIKLALQKAEIAAIDAIFPTGGGGGDGGIGSFFASLFGHRDGLIPGYATGRIDSNGIIRGPGTGTSDSIFAWMVGRGLIRVSNEEGIMNARAVRNFGPALKAMNDNTFPRFADGTIPAYPALPSASALSPVSVVMPAITINAPGADAAALARVQAELERLRAAMPSIAVSAVADARSRNMMR